MADEESVDVQARLEELGESQVRMLLSNGGLPHHFHLPAVEWLASKEKDKSETASTK